MVSFLKKLFGGTEGTATGAVRSEPVEYKGLNVQAAPESEGDQWRLAGYIIQGSGEELMERKFLRADLFSSHDEASDFAIRKGKQIIDENDPTRIDGLGDVFLTHPQPFALCKTVHRLLH